MEAMSRLPSARSNLGGLGVFRAVFGEDGVAGRHRRPPGAHISSRFQLSHSSRSPLLSHIPFDISSSVKVDITTWGYLGWVPEAIALGYRRQGWSGAGLRLRR
jgi:hypothetical protein